MCWPGNLISNDSSKGNRDVKKFYIGSLIEASFILGKNRNTKFLSIGDGLNKGVDITLGKKVCCY